MVHLNLNSIENDLKNHMRKDHSGIRSDHQPIAYHTWSRGPLKLKLKLSAWHGLVDESTRNKCLRRYFQASVSSKDQFESLQIENDLLLPVTHGRGLHLNLNSIENELRNHMRKDHSGIRSDHTWSCTPLPLFKGTGRCWYHIWYLCSVVFLHVIPEITVVVHFNWEWFEESHVERTRWYQGWYQICPQLTIVIILPVLSFERLKVFDWVENEHDCLKFRL